MFKDLFSHVETLARHRDGPFAEDRKRFLEHCSRDGFPPGYLRGTARMLLWIASELDASPGRSMTLAQIQLAAKCWCRFKYPYVVRRSHNIHPREAFIKLAVSWFRFLGRPLRPVWEPSGGF